MKANSLSFIIKTFKAISMLLFGFALGMAVSPIDPELWFMDWVYLSTPIFLIFAIMFILFGLWTKRQGNLVSGGILISLSYLIFGFCAYSMGYSFFVDNPANMLKWWFAMYYIDAITFFYTGLIFLLLARIMRSDEYFRKKFEKANN